MKISHLTLLCIFILSSQILQADCEKQGERKKERTRAEKGRTSQSGLKKQNGRGQKPKGQRGSAKNKFVTKEKAECTWALTEAETASLKVDCKNTERTFSCEFSGNPSTCPQYLGNKKAFWKQILRSLKKQKNICEDPKAVLKSNTCRQGPSAAHLRLVASHNPREEKPDHGKAVAPSTGPPATTAGQPEPSSSDCVEDVDYIDQRKVAEEFCSESWLSLCNFFIAMVQDKKCK